MVNCESQLAIHHSSYYKIMPERIFDITWQITCKFQRLNALIFLREPKNVIKYLFNFDYHFVNQIFAFKVPYVGT